MGYEYLMLAVREMPIARVFSSFVHRIDQYGIFHSICRTCSQTVAINAKESTLRHGEEEHECNDLAAG